MQAVITVQNAQARVHVDRRTITELQPLVAYRAQDLPPVSVQTIIKGFMRRPANPHEAAKAKLGMSYKTAQRYGTEMDLELLKQSHHDRLEKLGWLHLNGRQFEGALRLPGYWDGWRSLVSGNGWFGTGLVPHVARALTLRLGVQVEIRDLREPPPAARPVRPFEGLYGFQQEAIAAWGAAGGRGVIDLPPRSGKTHIALGILLQLGLPALVVVPRKVLVKQTVERFAPYVSSIAIQGGAPNATKRREMARALVWVATPQTAAGPKRNGERGGIVGIKTRKVLVIDEFHHSAAATYQAISNAATEAYYRLGLTGTHYRNDGKDLAMHAVLARAVYRRTVPEMVALGRLVPAEVAMVRVPGHVALSSSDRLYTSGVVAHEWRNAILAQAAQAMADMGKRVLVLTKEVKHAEVLAGMITGAVQVDGRDNAQVRPALRDLEAGRIRCVVGTSVIGEGVDVPAADALVYAAGGRSKVKVVQDYFRVLTASAGKTRGIVIDAADNHSGKLVESAAHRLRLYRSCFATQVIDHTQLAPWLMARR